MKTSKKASSIIVFTFSLLVGFGILGTPYAAIHQPASGQYSGLLGPNDVIQPGARISSAGTLTFLFEDLEEQNDAGEPVLYANTVGHGGTPEVGETIWLSGTDIPVGDVVAKVHDEGEDWALIRVDDESRDHVDYSMRHWTGPSDMPDPERIHQDDVVCWFGWGTAYHLHEETRPRCGTLTAATYRGERGILRMSPMTSNGGDSGGPVYHYDTGHALGMITSLTPPGEIVATDICTLLGFFSNHGYELKLATAEYDPPEASPTPPAPWTLPGFPNYSNWWKFETECLAG